MSGIERASLIETPTFCIEKSFVDSSVFVNLTQTIAASCQELVRE
jgi:hypothetical protein